MKRSDLVKKLEQFSSEMDVVKCEVTMTDGEGTVITISMPNELEEVNQ